MGKYFNKQTLVEALQQRAKELGRLPKPEDMINPPAYTYIAFFKKWEKALKVAGLNDWDFKTKSKACDADEKKTKDTDIHTSTNEHKNVEENISHGRRRYSKSIITKMLLDEFKRLGKKPTRKEIDANKNLPTVATCLSYFGTTRIGDVWDEILKDI